MKPRRPMINTVITRQEIKELYSNGHATKGDYTKALQSYQAYLSEIKSVQRDTAAFNSEEYRYFSIGLFKASLYNNGFTIY